MRAGPRATGICGHGHDATRQRTLNGHAKAKLRLLCSGHGGTWFSWRCVKYTLFTDIAQNGCLDPEALGNEDTQTHEKGGCILNLGTHIVAQVGTLYGQARVLNENTHATIVGSTQDKLLNSGLDDDKCLGCRLHGRPM